MPRHGETAAFIEAAIAYSGDDCLVWPYHRSALGYAMLHEFRGQRNYRVHRIVCERVHGTAPEDKPVVAHFCGNRACVAPAHLRWTTQADNLADMVQHGTLARGKKLPQTKLTAEDIPVIRELSNTGMNNVQIAGRYGVRREAIRAVLQGKAWAWL